MTHGHMCIPLQEKYLSGLALLLEDAESDTGWTLVLPDWERWDTTQNKYAFHSSHVNDYENTLYGITYCPFCGVSLSKEPLHVTHATTPSEPES
jgi:hypothetical protein